MLGISIVGIQDHVDCSAVLLSIGRHIQLSSVYLYLADGLIHPFSHADMLHNGKSFLPNNAPLTVRHHAQHEKCSLARNPQKKKNERE